MGRVIIQNMLTEGRGEHVMWPRRAGEKNMCGAVATPKGVYMDGTGEATPPGRLGAYS